MGRRIALIAAASLGVIALLALLADLVITRTVEARVAERLSATTGTQTEVTLHGWPASWRLINSGLPRTEITGRRVDQDVPVESFSAVLHDVRAEPQVLLGRSPVDLSARRAVVRVRTRGDTLPFGADEVDAVVTAPVLRIGEHRSRLEGDFVRIAGSADAVDGELVTATLTSVQINARHPGERLAEAIVHAVDARLRAAGDAGTGRLPLGMTVLALDVSEGEVRITRRRASVSAAVAHLEADEVPLTGTAAGLRSFEATLPGFRFDREHERRDHAILLHALEATFSAVVSEDAANELWEYPGRIAFRDGAVRLSAFGLNLDMEAVVGPRGVELRPVVPRLVAPLVGQLGPVVIEPDLPDGTSLTRLAVVPGELHLHGGGDRIVLPPPMTGDS